MHIFFIFQQYTVSVCAVYVLSMYVVVQQDKHLTRKQFITILCLGSPAAGDWDFQNTPRPAV